MEFYSATPSPAAARPSLVRSLGTLVLRLVSGLTLVGLHGWDAAIDAWRFVWQKEPWAFVDVLDKTGVPFASLVAPVFVALVLAGAAALLLGLLTRVTALALLALCLPVIFSMAAARAGLTEPALLYAGIFGALFFLGPGTVSLDALFATRRPKPKRPRPLA